ncbi:hypothetical protein SAMN02910342_02764 [Butyrivibrio sp. INlla21]|nr:hypothetical protein SAMN02910342_02764 [Butyrivibrio sp. INlla21]
MRKRVFLSTIIIAFALCACAKGDKAVGENISAVEESNEAVSEAPSEAPSEASSEVSSEVTASVEGKKYSDFKEAYADFLKTNEVDEDGSPIQEYMIYDIDKDGTPELLACCGLGEADSHKRVYTFADGEIKFIDVLYTSHTGIWTYPDDNGIILRWTFSGGEDYTRYSLNNNEFTTEELYSGTTFYEDPETGEAITKFKAAKDVVPGAILVSAFSRDNLYPLEMYEVISGDVPKQNNKKYTYPDNNPNFYTEIMEKDSVINVVNLGWAKDLGEIRFSELLKECVIDAGKPSEKRDITYADLNFDGVYECIFYITTQDVNYDAITNDYRVILSKQGDDIYAYLAGYPYENSVTEDGYFITEPDENCDDRDVIRVMYDKEKCFDYHVAY